MKAHLLVLFLIFPSHIETSCGFPDSGLDLACNGDIESVVGGGAAEEEFEMDSEVSWRMLNMQRKYISYETLKRDALYSGKNIDLIMPTKVLDEMSEPHCSQLPAIVGRNASTKVQC